MHRPQLIALAMVLLHPADLADGDDGTRAIRHSRLADLAVAGHSLPVIGMAWVSAKIYRIGIFMYGKKPSVRDLIRWARYK